MNINEYIKAVFNEKMQNFSISDFVVDFRKYLNVYADNYGFEGNINTFITDFNAEINSIKKVLVDEINKYIEELEKIDKNSNNYDGLFEEWYENIILNKNISKKIDSIYNKYMDIIKNQNADFRSKFKELLEKSFESIEGRINKTENIVKAEIAMLKGRKLYEDRTNDKLFNTVQYDISTDSFRVLDKNEFYLDRNSKDDSYKFNSIYFNKVFCKKHNDDLFFTLETDIGVKQTLMINENGFAYIDNEKSIKVIFDYETVSFITSNSKMDYKVTDEEDLEKVTILLNQIDINLVHLVKNKLSIKKSSELSENAKQFH